LKDEFIDFERFLSGLTTAENFFSDSYDDARARWLEAAEKAGASISSLRLGDNAGHFIDYARLGARSGSKVILHIAGTHGVEGFLGAAIQMAIFAYAKSLPADTTIIFIFCLNPWGMKHLRRTNEDNIDLNRNFRVDGFKNIESQATYSNINSFLNPKRAPYRFECFHVNLLIQIFKYGFSNLKQAIAGGQYSFPKGIYYGGEKISPNISALNEILKREITSEQVVLGLEVHSGLGPYAYDTLFGYFNNSEFSQQAIEQSLKRDLSNDDPINSVGFRTSGDVSSGVRNLLGDGRTGWILQEFGTYSTIRGLKVLRNENMHHFFGDRSFDHWSKKDFFEFFNPKAERWRRYVIGKGLSLIDSVVRADNLYRA
jgi:hypothetical protein